MKRCVRFLREPTQWELVSAMTPEGLAAMEALLDAGAPDGATIAVSDGTMERLIEMGVAEYVDEDGPQEGT